MPIRSRPWPLPPPSAEAALATSARRCLRHRLFAGALGGTAVAVAMGQTAVPAWTWWLLLLQVTLWPVACFAHSVGGGARPGTPARHLILDNLLSGFWVMATGLNLLPTVAIATLTGMSSLAHGGWRLFMVGLPAQLVGAAAAWLAWAPALHWHSDEAVVLATLPLLIGYPLMLGAEMHHVGTRLSRYWSERARSEQLHRETLDALEAGVVLYDPDDRLILCNADFRRLYAPIAAHLTPGAKFADVLGQAADAGLIPQARGQEQQWLAERLHQHLQPRGPMLREFPDGRWRRIVESRLSDGSLLAFSIDVTDLVSREKELQREVDARRRAEESLQQTNRRLEALSDTDALTGVANRRRFDRRFESEWRRAARRRAPLSLLILDVDHFKAYNDTCGHVEGDACLKRLAAELQQCVQRAGDLLARFGGEEFVILLPHAGPAEAMQLAQRCIDAVRLLALPHPASPVADCVTLSIGCATLQASSSTAPIELLRTADDALYRAKRGGRNRAVHANEKT